MSLAVLMFSPGFPDDMALFTAALAEVGAHVYGVGDQPPGALPEPARRALVDYLQVPRLWEPHDVLQRVRHWLRGRSLDRIECLWEPGMEVVAELREALGVPGMGREQTLLFRDKDRMKAALERAGLRVPRHGRASTAVECRALAERIGYPVVIKPVAGAGAADTYRTDDPEALERVLPLVGHLPEIVVEEFIEGEELTFDTICAGGEVLFHNVTWYRPRPLLMRQNPWISPVSITLRDTSWPVVAPGRDLGFAVLRALGFETGMTHMEWFLTPDGEAVFSEIGGRAPGGRLVHAMNYSADCDLFVAWAEAVCRGHISQRLEKRWNVGVIFKRAQGEGRISRVEGLESLMARFGEHIVHVDLLPIGHPRRDYRQVVEGDGWIVVRHLDLQATIDMADAVASDLRIHAA